MPSHLSRLSQSTRLSSLCYTATSYYLSILYMVMYTFECYPLNSSHLCFPCLCPQVCEHIFLILVKSFDLIWSLSPALSSKESACNAGNTSLIPGWQRCPGKGHGNPLQYSYLKNIMDRGAWQAIAMGSQRIGHYWSDSAWHGTLSSKITQFIQRNKVPKNFDISCTMHVQGPQD